MSVVILKTPGTVAHVDDHIFVAAQRAQLRGRVGLRGKAVECLAAAPVQRIGVGIGAAVEMHRLAEIDLALFAGRFEDAGLDQPVDDRIERRARRADPLGKVADLCRRAQPQQGVEDLDGAVDAVLSFAHRLRAALCLPSHPSESSDSGQTLLHSLCVSYSVRMSLITDHCLL